MKLTIRKKKGKNDMSSLFFDVTGNAKRQKIYLKMYVYDAPKTTEQKLHNRQQMEIAEKLRVRKEYELQNEINGFAKRFYFLSQYGLRLCDRKIFDTAKY